MDGLELNQLRRGAAPVLVHTACTRARHPTGPRPGGDSPCLNPPSSATGGAGVWQR